MQQEPQKKLIAFFKGTAGEYLKLQELTIPFLKAAADMRNHVSPYSVWTSTK